MSWVDLLNSDESSNGACVRRHIGTHGGSTGHNYMYVYPITIMRSDLCVGMCIDLCTDKEAPDWLVRRRLRP